MTELEKKRKFADMVFEISKRTGYNKPGSIADVLIDEEYPKTRIVSKSEHAFVFFRDGVVDAVRAAIRSKAQPEHIQMDLAEVCDQFKHIIGKLSSGRYYVPSLDEPLPIGRLIQMPAYLDEARKFHRRKGHEVLNESDVLDELYYAVTAKQPSLI
jgi:hypothetical protein